MTARSAAAMAKAVQDRRRSPALPEVFRRTTKESRRRGMRKVTTTARMAESTLMAMDGKNPLLRVGLAVLGQVS
jgi:hypothetical protein